MTVVRLPLPWTGLMLLCTTAVLLLELPLVRAVVLVLLPLGAELSVQLPLKVGGSLASAPLLPNGPDRLCIGGVFGLPRLAPILFTCSGSTV